MNKQEIRRQFRELRKKLPQSMRLQASLEAAQYLINHPLFQQSQHIACYLAYNQEIDAQSVIEAIWQQGKMCYLPVLTEAKTLEYVHYAHGDNLVPNEYAILEPANGERKFQAESLDLVVMPLVAFDLQGARMGTGGGYYDRTFAFVHGKPEKRPKMIGMAYAMQQADVLPTDPWDVLLDGVVTEKGMILLNKS